ncbi:hypothetical protein AUP68_10607 [Ilyonectria robusta]
MEIPKPVRKFKAIKEVVARFDLEFEAIKSPRDAYEEKVAAVNASIEEAWEQLSSNPNPSDKSRLQNEIVRHGGQLRELEIKHNATFEDEERGYGQQLQAAMKKLCDDLIETIGLSLVEESLHTLAARQSSQRDGDGPLDGLKKSASTSQETTRAELNRSARLHKSGPESILVQVCTDKRKNNFSGSPRERKRRQIDREPLLAEAKKTVDFEEVFQDGRARTKHVIVQFPTGVGAWYILQCAKHDLSFKDNLMERAATHLSGKEHGWSSQAPAVVVIKHLGVQVLGCNKTLANKNNSVALKEFQSGDEQSDAHSRPTKDHGPSSVIKTLRRPTRHSRRRHGDGNQLRDQDFEGIIDPTPGEVYLAFWKSWSAVLLLPMSNLDDVGVTGSLESLGLAENVPTCYDYDTQANSFEWREGYKTGQSLVTEREFPVMYFDGQDFPAKSAVGWVAARDLRIFDAKAGPSLVPYYQSVRKFLRHRASTRSVEIEGVEPDALGPGLPDGMPPRANFGMHSFRKFTNITLLPTETQNQPTSPLAPREAHGSPEHTISDAQDNPGTPSLAETFNTEKPASLPRNTRQANPSSESHQGTSQNDHFDESHEIISITPLP